MTHFPKFLMYFLFQQENINELALALHGHCPPPSPHPQLLCLPTVSFYSFSPSLFPRARICKSGKRGDAALGLLNLCRDARRTRPRWPGLSLLSINKVPRANLKMWADRRAAGEAPCLSVSARTHYKKTSSLLFEASVQMYYAC